MCVIIYDQEGIPMDDLRLIKDKYGEKMMHFCRSAFPTILETPGLLFNLLKDKFEFSKFLYEDIEKESAFDMFKDYINSMFWNEDETKVVSEKTPKELFEELGYDFYECKTEEEIQSFKKYYIYGEELCTFNGGRLNSCHVFFAVKKDVEKIKRLPEPKRQDEYGTSVMSIQFTKGKKNVLSIKNRYNHIVSNPDATFSNCLENITPGLTDSFEKTYNLNINQNDSRIFELNDYVRANDGKYYKYNYEIDNIYYCPNNIIIDNFEVIRDYQEKEKYLIIDYFIIDLLNKEIIEYDTFGDCFVDAFRDINRIEIIKNKDLGKTIKIHTNNNTKPIIIEIDKTNKIISYINNNVTEVEHRFMYKNKSLRYLEANQLKRVGNRFLESNLCISNINLPSIQEVGSEFFYTNYQICEVNLPCLKKVGNNFLLHNQSLKKICAPKLEDIGTNFMLGNRELEEVIFPELTAIPDGFLFSNEQIKKVYLPKVFYIGNGFLKNNNLLEEINLPNVIEIKDSFLTKNTVLKVVEMPSLKSIGNGFLSCMSLMEKISFPNLEYPGWCFLYFNESLLELNVPKLKGVTNDILQNNPTLRNKIMKQLGYEITEKEKILIKK